MFCMQDQPLAQKERGTGSRYSLNIYSSKIIREVQSQKQFHL